MASVTGPLRDCCPLCPPETPAVASSRLLQCSECGVFHYCGPEHQNAHRREHSSICFGIRYARRKVLEEERLLRDDETDIEDLPAVPETEVGFFEDPMDTRPYIVARLDLAARLISLSTLSSVKEAVRHFRDMLMLWRRKARFKLHNWLPAALVRLDLDQECCDFIKWQATRVPLEGHVYSVYTGIPYIEADPLEGLWFPRKGSENLDHIIAILILKLKLLVDIRNMKLCRKVFAQRYLPVEMQKEVEQYVTRSPLSTKFQRGSFVDLVRTEKTLTNQISELAAIDRQGMTKFLRLLSQSSGAPLDMPPPRPRINSDEISDALYRSHGAWWETEGVMDLVNDTLICATKASRNKTGVVADVGTEPNMQEAIETALADKNVEQVWAYLGWAVEDASYLGPWSTRPSEQYMRELSGRRGDV